MNYYPFYGFKILFQDYLTSERRIKMSIEEEKEILYDLMRQIVEERRLLSQLYFDLKEQVTKINPPIQKDQLEKSISALQRNNTDSTLKKEKEIQEANYFRRNRTSHHLSFERVANNIVYILKQSPIPLSNKELISRLTNEFEIEINYSNLTCNILPKMHKKDSIPVFRAYRGYWQYRKPNL